MKCPYCHKEVGTPKTCPKCKAELPKKTQKKDVDK